MLLSQLGVSFSVMVSDAEENNSDDDSGKVCLENAELKARDIAARIRSGRPVTLCPEGQQEGVSDSETSQEMQQVSSRESVLVIGADTVVSDGRHVLGKPKDEEDARRMLRLLSGKMHQVLTGVCAIFIPGEEENPDGGAGQPAGEKPSGGAGSMPGMREISFVDVTTVSVAQMTDGDIDEYIKSREPFDKAGGYGIQGIFARYVTGIIGDYNNVVGLPAGRVWRECIAPFLKKNH